MINKKRKTVLIILLIIVVLILCIVLCVLHISNAIKKNRTDLNKIRTVSELQVDENPRYYSIEEIFKSLECKNISYSKNNGKYHIEVEFKYNLYTKEKSNEEYFDKIVNLIKRRIDLPFEIVDNKKNITIYYDIKEEYYTINGIKDYYSNNSYLEVKNHKEIKSISNNKRCLVISTMITNSWNRHNLKLNYELNDSDNEFLYYDGFKINFSNININYIVFSKTFEEEVYAGIKVGTSFNKIKEILGNPTFTNDTEMIGYKDDDFYIFFYKNEIIVYPSSNSFSVSNIELEEGLIQLYEGKITKDKAIFVKDILEKYRDFKSEIIDDGIKVSSYLRGIDFYIYDNGKVKIEIFDNYKISSRLEKIAENNKVKLNYDKDSVYQYEKNRNSNQ